MILASIILAASGVLTWHPSGANYVESPWVVKDGNAVYLGGHAGWCCADYKPDGTRAFDQLWVAKYEGGRVGRTAYELSDSGQYDDHEVGGYQPIRVGGIWYMLGARTERSYWGQGNRLRPVMFMVGSSLSNLWSREYVYDRTPIFLPIQPECAEMGDVHEFCKNSIGCGQNGSIVTTQDGRLLIIAKDDVGPMVQQTSRHIVYEMNLWTWRATPIYASYWGCRQGLPGGLCPSAWPTLSDFGRIPGTGVLRAYTGNTDGGGGWYQSTGIVEWESWDEGRNWYRTGRTWKPEGGGCTWDVGVMKNPDGTIASPLTLVANYSEKCEWATSGNWNLWYWSEGPNPFYQGARLRVRR